MIDLTSLFLIAGVFLAAVLGDAALFGDRVQVHISVPAKIADTGFNEAAAEQVFAAQVAEMGRAISIVDTPSVQMSTRPTILAALAKPLSLENVVVAIQGQAGMDVVTVHGVILMGGKDNALDMVTVVSMPRELPVQIRLSQENGDATALVQRAAEDAMEWVAPYRLALTQFSHGLAGSQTGFARAKEIAGRAVEHPWVPSRATEQVMLHNLLAMLALLDGDKAAVEAQFSQAEAVPGASSPARGVIELNRSFLAVAARNPQEAARSYQAGQELTAGVQLQGWDARSLTLGGLVAWSGGDLVKAEALLRQAIADIPEDESPHAYLAQLLDAKGDAAGAAAERATARRVSRFDIEIPAQAQSLYWVDPAHGGLKRRE